MHQFTSKARHASSGVFGPCLPEGTPTRALNPDPTLIKLVRTAWSFDERECVAEVGW